MFSYSFYSSSCVSRILDMTCYNSIFIFIIFIDYVDYMFGIVGVVLYLYSYLYSAHFDDQRVGGKYSISMVLIHCLSANTPMW